jgi:serine/threonine-protein kinase
MGEVYRADDLKLGQAVALKFLPQSLEKDEARLASLLTEVRIARQIAHSSVCKVYDVGEADGRHFLSMEYVDGEDLATLLKRIGRLPKDKAVQIARQICAGLSAAHEQGILHRDLKPANVMIDGRGRARITDFGLAGLADDLKEGGSRAGTPAYMAPEQFSGGGITVRSDLYSLGLVLYELFTGQAAFKGSTPAEMARLKQESPPTNPSRLIEGFDPIVERVILRCLQSDPLQRPASALGVAAALPGGDPLAAALAAGETPSPELVAQAGETGGLSPTGAWMGLVFLAAGVFFIFYAADRSQLPRMVSLPKPPSVLEEKAREIVRRLGYSAPPGDTYLWFASNKEYLGFIDKDDNSSARWDRLAGGPPFAVTFGYRQSPRPLLPYNYIEWRLLDDPPYLVSGMAGATLAPDGRLVEFLAVPPELDPSPPSSAAPRWEALFGAAKLDPAAFSPATPEWFPPVYADSRAAWVGSYATNPRTPIRIEAAAYRGKPVFFRIVEPWAIPNRMEAARVPARTSFVRGLLITLGVSILAGGILIARRNLRLGRGDRKGARKLSIFLFVAAVLEWLFLSPHWLVPAEFGRALSNAGLSLLEATIAGTFYLALEPYFRRVWPHVLTSWMRFLDGQFRDPLVGRDVFIGLLAGTVFRLLEQLHVIIPRWLGLPPMRPDYWGPGLLQLVTLESARNSVGVLFNLLQSSLLIPMILTILLLLLRILLRSQALAIGATVTLFSAATVAIGNNLFPDLAFGLLQCGLYIVLLFRFGFLPIVVSAAFSALLYDFPLTLDFSTWYAGNSFLVLLIATGLAAYALAVALAGRPLFRETILPE